MPVGNSTLIHFGCATIGCGYEEDIGFGISAGLVISGSVTIICPRCGSVIHIDKTTMALPVRFQSERGPRLPQP
ncbi:MAG: hypothetical protein WC869_00605 [Phycisphaerae bacterium]|jgi:hypothetical protein